TPSLGLPKGLKIKSHIKSQSQSQSQSGSKDHSLRQFLHGIGCVQLEIGRLAGRLREQARSHSGNGCGRLEIGRLSGRHRQQAGSYNLGSVHPIAAKPPHSTQ
ncbi:hypothetical protein, partial [Pseudomonas sp. MWU12-2323]|uniref:hypothetical protein n=1 Tax=Pseudomonas sp. MWU12-2323 TaxID=2651296 RepID=UPI001C499E5D